MIDFKMCVKKIVYLFYYYSHDIFFPKTKSYQMKVSIKKDHLKH